MSIRRKHLLMAAEAAQEAFTPFAPVTGEEVAELFGLSHPHDNINSAAPAAPASEEDDTA